MLPFYYKNFQKLKIILIINALIIVLVTLIVMHKFTKQLDDASTQQMQIWAEAMHKLAEANENDDISILFSIINENTNIPVILADSNGNVTDFYYCIKNIRLPQNSSKTKSFIKDKIKEFKKEYKPIEILLKDGTKQYVYYGESYQIKSIRIFTITTLGILIIFLIVVSAIILYSKRAEQNLVWIGLTKETAHQLGTPISSLLAWIEVLKIKYPESEIVPEMGKDVNRLQLIAERFSKIGSKSDLEAEPLIPVINSAVNYLKKRISKKITISTNYNINSNAKTLLSKPLFEWVIENLCKNAADAIEGNYGTIDISVSQKDYKYIILIKDSGKGIQKKNFKTVFTPGFTTKKRGWGLGLSLVKRIVETYLKGHIYIKSSKIGKGTTFCIELKVC